DAASWYWLAESLPPKEIDKAIEYLEKAYRLDPHLYQAIFALRTKLRISGRDVARADVLFKEERLLSPAAHDDQFGNIVQKAYGEMGKYGRVIGLLPDAANKSYSSKLPLFVPNEKLKIQLAEGTRWASAADLGSDPIGKLRQRVRARFGGTIVVLDYDRDGK